MLRTKAFLTVITLTLIIGCFTNNAAAFPRPNSTITDPADGAVISSVTYVVTGTAAVNGNRGLSKVEVSINDGPWQLANGKESWSCTCAMPADGVCSIKSKATDTAGTEEITGAGVTITVDNSPPSTSIADPENGAAVKGMTITVSGTADDGIGSGVEQVEISTDGGVSWVTATGSSVWTYDWNAPMQEDLPMWRVASATIRDGQSGETMTVRVKHLLNTTGSQLRVGFVSGTTQPVTINEAYVGNDAGEGAVSGNVQLMFGGNASVSIPAAQIAYSDPVTWAAVRGDTVVITSYGTGISYGKDRDFPSYFENGNVAGVTRPLTNMVGWDHGYDVWNALLVETLTEGVTVSDNVLVIGDSIGLGGVTTPGEVESWTRLLGSRANVYNASRSGTTAAYESGLVSDMLNRGISYSKAIISLGTNDLTLGYSDSEIEANLCSIISDLKSAGLTVYAGNILPRSADSSMETVRLNVNNWLNTLPCGLDGVFDLDAATRDPENPISLHPVYDSGDGLHPNSLGHAAMFDCINANGQIAGGMIFDIYARATDAAGNVEDPGASVRVTIDNDAPSSEVALPVNYDTLYGTIYKVWGTADDGGGSGVEGVEVSMDGGASWSSAVGGTVWNYNWLMPVSGSFTLMSRATDRAGNTGAASEAVSANITPFGSPELQHYNWDYSIARGGCNFCHTPAGTFLAQSFREGPGFCRSCHNSSGVAHESGIYGPYGHSIMVNVTSGGSSRFPTYGNITTGEYNNQPFSRLADGNIISCVTCHNDMRKAEDYGRTWEYTNTDDQLTYSLKWGGWGAYGYLVPTVYEDDSLWPGPQYSREKKRYLVDPSEYTYDEVAGTITFATPRPATDYIFVSLGYPYLRASSQDDRLCSDCHTQATHMGANCLRCHQSHNTPNLAGIRGTLRTTDRSERAVEFTSYTGYGSFADGDTVHSGVCEVCHTRTRYYTRDGSGFANHSGGLNYDGDDCTACHPHSNGFSKYSSASPMQPQGSGEAALPLPLQGYSM